MAGQQIFVIDTSVVIKWFTEEVDSTKAQLLRHKFDKGTIHLIAPALIIYEFCNVAANKFSLSEARKTYELLSNMNLELVHSNPFLMRQTIQIAKQHNISGYDACFVALAQILEVPLLTADEKLQRKVGEGVELLAKL